MTGPQFMSAPLPGFRGLRVHFEQDYGAPGFDLLVDAGDIRLMLTVEDAQQPVRASREEVELAQRIAQVLASAGVSRGLLRSPHGGLALWALARYCLEQIEVQPPLPGIYLHQLTA